MIGTEHNPLLQGGGWQIQVNPPTHKKDRAQAVYYTLRGRGPGRGPRRRDHLTPSERFALENGLWIAERPSDQIDLVDGASERTGLVRAVQLNGCSGGLLLDRLEDLGDVLTQAAVTHQFHRLDRRVVVGGRVVTDETRGRLLVRAGGTAAVEDAARRLWIEAMRGLSEYMRRNGDRSPFLVGSGAARDYEAACDYAECLRLENYGRKEILERLNLEGWLNVHERRCWHTGNYPVRSA